MLRKEFVLLKKKTGNSTYAGVTAAVVANLILVAYLLVAFWEEDSTGGSGAESKKNR